MRAKVVAAIAALDELVDYFIPASISSDRDARNRARVFLISHLLGPFIGNVIPISIFVLDPNPGYDVAVLAVSITSFWVFPFVLRTGVRYDALALVSIENLIFCIFWSCFFYGGVTSPTLAWVLIIPLLAFFYLQPSNQLRVIVMIMFAANVGLFGALYLTGVASNDRLPVAAVQGLGMVSTTAAAIYVAMMALYYAKIQASQSELESEVRDHIATASALRAATAEAERAGAAKAEFLAKMSHELRTPLNAVIGYSQILLEDAAVDGDTESVADLTKIHAAGQHLLKLVNEILDLSKIEAGKMELDQQVIGVEALLDELCQTAAAGIEANGNIFVRNISANLGTALCDVDRVKNMIGQLLDNAAKFTQGGRVELSALRQSGGDCDQLVVQVLDTGIGIAPEQIPNLFEKFNVIDDLSTSKYGGTGLGLALAQRLSRLMGGEISAESELGKGSQFTVRLPLISDPNRVDLCTDATLAPTHTAEYAHA
jgi:signal transduction histidine kinase